MATANSNADFVEGDDLDTILVLLENDSLEKELEDDFFEVTKDIEDGDFKCTLCPKVCKSRRGLTRHKNAKHYQEREENNGVQSRNDELDTNLLLALVNESIKEIAEDKCFPSDFCKQFEIYECCSMTDEKRKQEIVAQILKILNALRKTGNVEKFYATFYATVVPKACMLFSSISAQGATVLCTKLADKIVAHTRSNAHEILPRTSQNSLSDEEKASLQYLGGYVFYNLNRKIFSSKHHNSDIGQQHLAILKAGRLNNDSSCQQKLVDNLSRGGLWKINETSQKILTIAELKFLQNTNVKEIHNIDYKKLVNELCMDQDLLASYQTLISSAALQVDADIAYDVLEKILMLYIKVRSFSYAKDIVNRFKLSQRKGKSKALRKEIQRATEKPATEE